MKLKSLFVSFVFTLLFTPSAFAQTPPPQATPASKLTWNQTAASASEAQAFVYKHYDDANATTAVFTGGVALTGVTCAGAASPFTCEVPFPAFTPTSHQIAITASNSFGESAKSAPLAFTFGVIPAVPTGLGIK